MSLQIRLARHARNSTANTNATVVRTTPGRLRTAAVSNTGAAVRFVKLYDMASAPVPASDVPLLVIPVAANGVLTLNFGDGWDLDNGLSFTITGGAGDTDATAVGAGEVKVLLGTV